VPGWWEADVAAHPAHAAALWPEILAWGADHGRALAAARGRIGDARWWMSARCDDPERIAALEACGFRHEAWVTLRYERALAEPLPLPALPDGFTVRPLCGEAEVPAYVATHRAAFGTTGMTEEWRQRVLRTPGYRPDLDLVVAAPDGRVAAFAILWVGSQSGDRREGQFEPVGVHPDYQRRGLGRALILEGMRRLRDAGATHAIVQTENTRTAANALYGSVMRDTGVRTRHYSRPV
jgi:ribosomal protein S18 acetylase RimI-like enzyme